MEKFGDIKVGWTLLLQPRKTSRERVDLEPSVGRASGESSGTELSLGRWSSSGCVLTPFVLFVALFKKKKKVTLLFILRQGLV